LHRSSCADMPSPISRRIGWMRSSLASPAVAAFPEILIGSASALLFSRPAQRSLTFGLSARQSPKATLCTEGFSRFVTSTTAPIATGWSDSCRAGLPPLEDRAFARRTKSMSYLLSPFLK
jgi:hypothetical protein